MSRRQKIEKPIKWENKVVLSPTASKLSIAAAIIAIACLIAICFIIYLPKATGRSINVSTRPWTQTINGNTRPSSTGPYSCIPNTLDANFGNGGVSLNAVPFLPQTDVYCTAQGADGYYYQCGAKGNVTVGQLAVMLFRVDSHGVLDSTFGYKTYACQYQATPVFSIATYIVAQGNKMLMGVTSRSSVTSQLQTGLIRVTLDGVLDPTFANSGSVSLGPGRLSTAATVPVVPQLICAQLALTSDDKIVILMQDNSTGNPWLARTDGNGNLDTSFGTDGFLHINLIGVDQFVIPIGLAIDSTNRILFSCSILNTLATGHVLAFGCVRVTTAGVVDGTFGTSGYRALVPWDPAMQVNITLGIVLQSTGKIVISCKGNNVLASAPTAALFRLNTDGSQDMAFGDTAGFCLYPTGLDATVNSIVVDGIDAIIGAGYVESWKPASFRLSAEGAIDTAYGTSGVFLITPALSSSGHTIIERVFIDSNGGYIQSGSVGPTDNMTLINATFPSYYEQGYIARICPP